MDTWEKRVYQAAYSCRGRIYKKVVSFREKQKVMLMIPKKFCQLIKESAKRHDIDKVYDGDKAYMTIERTSIYWTT
jgi:hypothetical protein